MNPALRSPRDRMPQASLLQHSRLQPLADRSTDHAVTHPAVEKGSQMAVVQLIKEAPDIHLQHPPAAHSHQRPPEIAQCVMGRATRPEAVRTGQEVLFVDRLQHHCYGTLKHLVFEGGNPDRAGLRPASFRDVDPLDRGRLVLTRLEAVEERPEIVPQMLRVLLSRRTVYAYRPILASPGIGFLEPVLIDVVSQAQERPLWILSRQSCYPTESR
jgi:hypothetical protein